ncbi:SUKH-4 family immunity protein [Streptomyces prasinus]|uniref:SUKH-4 family immunity protein n=1 Tax=Streptomyces prasinus TaxID=67345 RepID=UPI00099E5CB6|nr:SUKH-4 family immunity protein [Streptomyces prasinus]
MLIRITPRQVVDIFGLTCVTYFPRSAGSHMRSEVAHFLSDVGLPESSFFSCRFDLEDESLERIDGRPTLKTAFEADGAECPPESEGWEILGVFNYATVAIDPSDGRIFSFPEGEENYTAMNADLSSFVHSLLVLEQGKSEYKGLPVGEGDERARVVERARQQISEVDETPFADEDSEWSRIFEEIGFGMWG